MTWLDNAPILYLTTYQFCFKLDLCKNLDSVFALNALENAFAALAHIISQGIGAFRSGRFSRVPFRFYKGKIPFSGR
jgi:hypothetical protein